METKSNKCSDNKLNLRRCSEYKERKRGQYMNYLKQQAVQRENQVEPPERPDNIDKLLNRINRCNCPRIILSGLSSIKPLVKQGDDRA